MESWAFGVDRIGLKTVLDEGVFHVRKCKLCSDGIVIKGEYGLSTAIFNAGYNIATIMSMCAPP